MTVYALMVGVDAYRAVSPLRGCRADVTAAQDLLTAQLKDTPPVVRTLLDGDATRATVIDGIRTHLGLAGPGDTALFWFAGHGSQAPAPPGLWYLEPTGMVQTLICADSREHGVPDLYDKELAVLLGEVAARGAHTVAVLDCCYAGGAARNEVPEQEARARYVPARHDVPDMAALVAAAPLAADAEYVALAACRSFELAQEFPLDGLTHGVFTWALLRALARLGLHATSRDLLTRARCLVEDVVPRQVPELFPQVPGPGDRPFLGGPLAAGGAGVVMRHLRGAWEIDAGTCHGLPPGTGDGVRVAVAGEPVRREARVVSVRTERSLVEPAGWEPDEEKQYPVVLASMPLPATTVAVDGAEPVVRALTEAMGPSPHVRLAVAEVPELRVRAEPDGRIRILGTDTTPVAPEIAGGPAALGRVVETLEHIARWRQVKALDNPLSALASRVRVEIVEAWPGERRAPLDRRPIRPGPDGSVRLNYRWSGHGWTPPTVFIRLHNHADRPLHFVLLDLTDRYRVWAGLFPGGRVEHGRAAAALEGRPVQVGLPPDMTPAPGREVRDWLKLFVAEEHFSSRPFELPRLGDPGLSARRDAIGLRGVLDRLGRAAVHRDASAVAADDVYDWATVTVPIRTVVPEGRP
ncbi:caspase domain-containing protein [Micromonospora sp. NPDC005686]|uniref:caspase family protein n=1 Tax=unclassified Micromonospora TaxID=2617518 RepID=UPI0033A97A8D